MKYLQLLKRSRWICGGLCLCLAYAPLLLKSKTLPPPTDDGISLISANYKPYRNIRDCAGSSVLGNPECMDGLHFAAARIADSLSSLPIQKSFSQETPELFCAFHDDLKNNLYANINALVSEKSLKKFSNSASVAPTAISSASVRKVTIVASPKKHAVNIAGYPNATLVKGRLKNNFYADAKQLKIPPKIIKEVVSKMASKINFKNSLKRGDIFEVIYTKDNNLLYSRIITKYSIVAVYRFSDGGNYSYCFENGDLCEASKEDNTFGRPLKGKVVISDRYGMRRHPISRTIRFHSGVDLAAAFGEPVYAIQDGTVTRASYFGGYGKCVDIRHASGYSSRYAHLSRLSVINGNKVKKGQLIGFVGSTGCSTGAHLHLELARNDKTMNPFSVVKIVPAKGNTVKNFKSFECFKNKISAVSKKYKAQ